MLKGAAQCNMRSFLHCLQIALALLVMSAMAFAFWRALARIYARREYVHGKRFVDAKQAGKGKARWPETKPARSSLDTMSMGLCAVWRDASTR
jgi:hypothetical protein